MYVIENFEINFRYFTLFELCTRRFYQNIRNVDFKCEYITGSKCVDKSPTCTNSAFQAFACPDKEFQKSCMKSCGLCRKIYIDNR